MASPSARGDLDIQAPEVRQRIAAAGRELFAAQGYERTTVEAIAERAGVARRTFFRHFRAKDDVIFPDHDRVAHAVAIHLESLGDMPPLRAVCSGARLVFGTYVDEPAVSVQRYLLVRSVPALRDREIAGVSTYIRLFSRYLHERMGGTPESVLTAEVAAASIVAAHNHVLREWLRNGGTGDPFPALDRAFDWVVARLSGESDPEAGDGEDVVVAVFRAGDSMDDVMERISRSL